MPMVLDASVTLVWCFPDEVSSYADLVLESLRITEARVPAIWAVEVVNALIAGERRQRLMPAQVLDFLDFLRPLQISVWPADLERSFGAVRSLARAQNLSAYDASYMDVALASGLPLATLDVRLREAATRVGVPLVQ